MKKSFVFAAAVAVALASCTNEESSIKMTDKLGQSEVAIYPFSKTATRGFVTENEFFEWRLDELRNAADGSKKESTKENSADVRDMHLSVYNEVGKCDLFIGKTFMKEDSDEKWHATPHIYYPIGYGDFDFLAYSLGEHAPSATWNGAKEVTLEVTKDCLTDDILYAGGVQNAKTHAAASMLFGHAQAWLTTRFTVDAGSPENVLKIKSVTWQDVYASGELNIKFNKTTDNYMPDAKWNFFTQETSNVVMPDRTSVPTYGANVHCMRQYKKVIDDEVQDEWEEGGSYHKDGGEFVPVHEGEGKETDNLTKQNYLDMLIPAQPKKPFVIEYTLDQGDGAQTYEYTVNSNDLITGDWKMGTHYIYNIEFSITEITTAPTVKTWLEESVLFDVDGPLAP